MEAPDALEGFARQMKSTHPILARGREVFNALGVQFIPANFAIDREGRLIEEIESDPVERIRALAGG